MLGSRFWWQGEELEITSEPFALHGGSFLSAVVVTGAAFGRVVTISEEQFRPELRAARIAAENAARRRVQTPQVT